MRRTVFVILLVGMAQVLAFGQAATESSRFEPKYVIYRNHVKPKMSAKDVETRSVWVLMDPKGFDVDGLRTVFDLIRKRFPKPYLLSINLFTDFSQISTPEEEDIGGQSGHSVSAARPDRGKRAIFIRSINKGFFYMREDNNKPVEIQMD